MEHDNRRYDHNRRSHRYQWFPYVWTLLSEEKYSCSANVASLLHTYLCETKFSRTKIITSEHRTTLSDDHLEQGLRLAVSDHCPDCDHQLANDTLCHTSSSTKQYVTYIGVS